jgi:hypothetical protein
MVWDTSEVEVWASVSGDHFLMIHGRFIKSNEEFYLFNVYAPCDYRAKLVFPSSLSARLELIGSQKVCVVRISMRCDVGRNVVLLGVVTCLMILSTLISSLMITFWFIYLCVIVSLLGSRLTGVQ